MPHPPALYEARGISDIPFYNLLMTGESVLGPERNGQDLRSGVDGREQ